MRALVAGSAQLDVIATVSDETVNRKHRNGRITMEVGGTACNVAFGLRRTGADVHLLTAWNESPLSKIVASHILATGVHVFADELPGTPLAAQILRLSATGGTDSTVSSSPLDAHQFAHSQLKNAIRDVDCVVFDTNLSQDSIRDLCVLSQDRGVPVFGLAVSEQKVSRILSAASMLTAAVMNHLECEELMITIGAADASEVANVLKAPIFVTRGERGAMIYEPEERPVRVPAHKLSKVTNLLGVGDAFAVGVIDAMARFGMAPAQAAAYAHNFVGDAARSESANAYSLNAFSNLLANLYKSARHDALTGLLTRGAFEDDFTRFAKGVNTIIMIDCDHFKAVNDRHGHDKGDEVLCRVAEVINKSVRYVDIACRWGGDEFVILLPRTSVEDALIVANRIRETAEDESATLYGVTVSVGLSETTPGEALSSVVQRSDEAMYASKSGGKNAVTCFSKKSHFHIT